ncbi:MAG TPA: hypothetical protein VFB58_13540 [Chloroflexota bacterium]|nr:hypothetical protein [Chloroflexota bacterium]
MMEGILDIPAVVAPLRRHVGVVRVLRFSLDGLIAGAVLSLVLLFLHLGTPALLLAPVLLGVLGGTLVGLWRWPDVAEIARLADRAFHLQDRLITAWELRLSDEVPAVLQRREVERRLAGQAVPSRAGRQFPPVHGVLALGAVLALAVSLRALPAPRQALSTDDKARIHQAALVTVPHLLNATEQRLQHAQQKKLQREVRLILHHLQRQLLHASSRAAALQALSIAQMRLHSAASTPSPLSRALLSALAQADRSTLSQPTLPRLLTALANEAGKAPQSNQRLAQSLLRAAQTAGSGKLDQTLRTAAKSLLRGNAGAAGKALRAAARSNAASGGTTRPILHAANQLDQVKNSVAGLDQGGHRRSTSSSSSRNRSSGHAVPALAGIPRGGGHTSILRRQSGTSPSGRSVMTYGQTSHNQGSLTIGTHRGGAGGIGSGGADNRGGQGRGRYVTVHIPGQGGGKTIRVIVSAPGSSGNLLPYHIVLVRYRRQAFLSLQRSTIPSSLQRYILQYFSTISQ